MPGPAEQSDVQFQEGPGTGAPGSSWYFQHAEGVRGPFTRTALEDLVRRGLVSPEHLVWRSDWPEWVPLSAAVVAGTLVPRVRPESSPLADTLPLKILAGIVACYLLYFAAGMLSVLDGSEGAGRPGGGMSARAAGNAGAVGPDPGGFNAPPAGGAVDVTICNHTGTSRVYVSLAYFDALRGEWMTRGWFPYDGGDCRTTLRQVKPPVFVYAEADDGGPWNIPGSQTGEFCIDQERSFVLDQNACERSARSTRRRVRFSELTTSDAHGNLVWEVGR